MDDAGARRDVPAVVERPAAAALFALAAFLLVFRAGALSWTWDESIDVSVVRCIVAEGDPFACRDDISQTRLPIHLHAAVAALTGSIRAHYVLSATFALANLALVYGFARRRFGVRTALLALGLAATAPALLASGRMLLSHANVVFTTFSLITLFAFDRFAERGDRRFFWASAVAFGLAVASSVLGLFHALAVAGLWLFVRREDARARRAWEPFAYGVVALAVFFAATVIYVRPENLEALVQATVGPDTFPYPLWNYLELGTGRAPHWYSALLFAVRATPWWAALFLAAPLLLFRTAPEREARRGLVVLWAVTTGVLLLKAAVFRYDAPHQQAPWYPIVFVFVAAAVVDLHRRAARLRPAVVAVAGVLLAVQVHDAVRFFPNHLFYGAQYGQRFIGEFYGPAVLHKQGRAQIDAAIDELVAADPSVRILVADTNGFEEQGPQFVPFTRRDPSETYRYALADRLHATHLEYPEREAYNALLARDYRVLRSLDYPLGEWAYRIYELAPAATRGMPTTPTPAVAPSTSSSPSTTR